MVAQLGSIPPKQTITVDDLLSTDRRLPSSIAQPTEPLAGQIAGYIVGHLPDGLGVNITPGKGFEDSDLSYSDTRHAFFQRLDPSGLPTSKELTDFMNSGSGIDPNIPAAGPAGGFMIQVQ